MRKKTMNRLALIENEWDCPHFVDGFHKTDSKLPRFGCKLLKVECNLKGCPLPKVPEDFMKGIRKE